MTKEEEIERTSSSFNMAMVFDALSLRAGAVLPPLSASGLDQ